VLHPCHKLHYFKTAGWQDDWIQTTETLVHNEFECSYLSANDDNDSNLDKADKADIGGKEVSEKKVHIFYVLIILNPVH